MHLQLFLQVTEAELKIRLTLFKYNAPFLLAETLSPLIRQILKNSRIATWYVCSRTKTMSVINGVLGSYFKYVSDKG